MTRAECEAKLRLLQKMWKAETAADARYSARGEYDKAKYRLCNALALGFAIDLAKAHITALPK